MLRPESLPIVTYPAIGVGLDLIALGFLGILLGSFALEYLQTWVLQMTGQRIMFDMRMQIYGHLQRVDVQYYDRNPVGRLMTRVTTDVDVLNDLFAGSPGRFVYEEMPGGARRAGMRGRGLEGLADAVLKVFGI